MYVLMTPIQHHTGTYLVQSEMKKKMTQIRKEEINVSIHKQHIRLCKTVPQIHKKILELISLASCQDKISIFEI